MQQQDSYLSELQKIVGHFLRTCHKTDLKLWKSAQHSLCRCFDSCTQMKWAPASSAEQSHATSQLTQALAPRDRGHKKSCQNDFNSVTSQVPSNSTRSPKTKISLQIAPSSRSFSVSSYSSVAFVSALTVILFAVLLVSGLNCTDTVTDSRFQAVFGFDRAHRRIPLHFADVFVLDI